MDFKLFSGEKKTLNELEEENEELRMQNENVDLKLSLKQKQELYKGMKQNGLSLKNFNGSLKSAWAWWIKH